LAVLAGTAFGGSGANPSRASQDSLGATYEHDGETKIVRPGFIFFARLKNGTIAAGIVDPHGTQYAGALPKLKGLARYAGANATFYRRIEAIAKVGEKFRALDLTEAATREAVLAATDIANLHEGQHAADYFVG
jgi:type III restriction enzyme